MAKNTGKVREKSGNFVSPEKWEPCVWRGMCIVVRAGETATEAGGTGMHSSL